MPKDRSQMSEWMTLTLKTTCEHPQFMSSGLGRRLRGLHFRQLALIEPDEIDRVQHQRRGSPGGNGALYDLPRKRKQESPALGHQQRGQSFLPGGRPPEQARLG